MGTSPDSKRLPPERWQLIAAICESVLDQPVSERAALLASACGDDEQLRSDVESLLAHENGGSPLDRPVSEADAALLLEDRLVPGTRVGPYAVEGVLGAGGMGEVYRARDSKLGRTVALKVLPSRFATDAERIARFRREAQVLATLNHPHIGAIYGLEESVTDGRDVRALVLELVDGATLAERLARGPLPLDESIAIARQLVDALEAAHERGIVHRDLKPSNIKLRPDGTVKVLDFGLAKLVERGPADPAASPTITSPVETHAGAILGTAAYMSPEQAKGRAAEKRSDIWAFGCVLFEMLTGRRAFAGDNVSETLASILRDEPHWASLRDITPAAIRKLLVRCLQKDPRRRLADIADARLDLEDADDAPLAGASAKRTTRAGAARLAWVAMITVAIAAGIVAVTQVWNASPPPEMRLDLAVPPTTEPWAMAISPDGQKVAYVSGERLWLRVLNEAEPRLLPGTDGASYAFWHPDSRALGFTTVDNSLKITDIAGAPVRRMVNGVNVAATWNGQDAVLTAGGTGPLLRFSVTGSERTRTTRHDGRSNGHWAPHFLPDGEHFLFYIAGTTPGVWVGRLGSLEATRLLDANSGAVYAGTGHLLFVRGSTLYAQGFDTKRLELRGEPTAVARQVSAGTMGELAASASQSGSIIYRTGALRTPRRYVWFDRSGQELGSVGEPLEDAANASLSPDGRRIALRRTVDGNSDIWLLDIATGRLTRFTTEDSYEQSPLWSPDGTRITYLSNRMGSGDLYVKPVNGGREEVLLSSPEGAELPRDWSSDGRHLLYVAPGEGQRTGNHLWALPLMGDRKPFLVTPTNFVEHAGQFSPDNQWIAYQSNEAGVLQIYVQPFPGPGPKQMVSTAGGSQVRWRHDGKALFYIGLDDWLMEVPIRLDSRTQTAEAGRPVPLFKTRIGGALARGGNTQQYMVSRDGRFLMRTVGETVTNSPITVVLNWRPETQSRN